MKQEYRARVYFGAQVALFISVYFALVVSVL